MKILSHTTKSSAKRDYLVKKIREIQPKTEIIFIENEDTICEFLQETEIFLTYNFRREWWNSCSRLKWVHIGGAGINHIKFAELMNSEVIVTNSKGIHRRPMAEYTLGAMLYFSQKLQYAIDWRKDRDWLKAKNPMTRQSFILENKKVSIIGGGSIGQGVLDVCLKMGMRAFVINRTRRSDLPWQVRTGDFNNLDEAMSWGDFIVLCLPLTDETRGCIDGRRIALMTPGSFLINIARGGIVDEMALAEALTTGKISGACLDVFDKEPLPPDYPLFDIPNLLMTPHISGNFPEYTIKVMDLFISNFERYINKEPLVNVIDWQKGY